MWVLESLLYETWNEILFHGTVSSLNISFVLNDPKKNAKMCNGKLVSIFH